MIRFWRALFFGLGFFIAVLTILRAAQPPHTTEQYRIVYGDLRGRQCCDALMINEERRQANRVQVALASQPLQSYTTSPDRTWRFVRVEAKRGQYTLYFLPQTTDDEPLAATGNAAFGYYYHWHTAQNTLYYLFQDGSRPSAMYRISPDSLDPERITQPIFWTVRSIHEQPLPDTDFFPWVLLFWAVNALLIAGGLKYIQRR